MACRVVIIDYDTGNLASVKRSLRRIGCEAHISSSSGEIANADKLILSGVGHFRTAMDGLKRSDVFDALDRAVLIDGKPVLGICLGMELMAKSSEEGNLDGLGWFDATVERFAISDTAKFKVPQIGWNSVSIAKDSRLMAGIAESTEFYFNHSYHLKLTDDADLLNQANYEKPFTAAIEKQNIFGVQYHPEKSHDVGLRVLKNFVDL